MDDAKTLFDWLELTVRALVPLTIALLGFMLKRYVDSLERSRFSFELAAIWREEVFREISTNINLLQKFHCYFGDWRSLNIDDVRSAKRRADEVVFGNKFLWNRDFIQAWQEFNDRFYAENRGCDLEFLFRANINRHRDNLNWKPSWEDQFVSAENRARRNDFLQASNDLLSMAATDIGINIQQ